MIQIILNYNSIKLKWENTKDDLTLDLQLNQYIYMYKLI